MQNKIDKKRIDQGLYWQAPLTLVDGCTPVSPGCANCWSASVTNRFKRLPEIVNGNCFNGKIQIKEKALEIPGKRRTPTVFAVWNDLFHENVPTGFIFRALKTMSRNPQHTFIILTKRANIFIFRNLFHVFHGCSPGNIYFGVSVENQQAFDRRAPLLLRAFCKKKILSIEPLLGPIYITDIYNLSGIDWVVVGAESLGPRPGRKCKIEWIESIVDECVKSNVKVFVKQLHINGKLVKDINKFPETLRLREFPGGA